MAVMDDAPEPHDRECLCDSQCQLGRRSPDNMERKRTAADRLQPSVIKRQGDSIDYGNADMPEQHDITAYAEHNKLHPRDLPELQSGND